MALPIKSGIAVGIFPNNSPSNPPDPNSPSWYHITDHNRGPVSFSYENIEKVQRMANGFMRKYVVAQKRLISTDWSMVPSVASVNSIIKYGNPGAAGDYTASNAVSNITVDGLAGGGWLKEFYERNLFIPMWIKITHSTASSAGTGTYASGFWPIETQTSQMNSSSYFTYPIAPNVNAIPATGSANPDIFYGYMTDFSYSVQKRFTYTDYVNMGFRFVEA